MFRTLSLALAASVALIAPVTAQERAVPDTQAQVQLSFAPVVRQAAPAVVNVYSHRVIAQRTPFAGDPFSSVSSARKCVSVR